MASPSQSATECLKSSLSENDQISVTTEDMMEVDNEGAEFTDPKSIHAPENLQELIRQLHKVFAKDEINIDYVKALMESYKSKRDDWKRFAKFDPHRYTRNLVDQGNGKFNLMILCWNESQGSGIHSHAGSHCFLKVLEGEVKEELYAWPDMRTGRSKADSDQGSEMTVTEELTFQRDLCTYICDDLGLHRVENTSHVNRAVTLHLYSPPFDHCLSFNKGTGRHSITAVTF